MIGPTQDIESASILQGMMEEGMLSHASLTSFKIVERLFERFAKFFRVKYELVDDSGECSAHEWSSPIHLSNASENKKKMDESRKLDPYTCTYTKNSEGLGR